MHDCRFRSAGVIGAAVIIGAAVAIAIIFSILSPASVNDASSVTLLGPGRTAVSVEVELADSPEERERGLMERKYLPEGKGMLFAFTDYLQPARLSFWMKNTLIPLDILFFGEDGALVSAAHMDPCDAEPCPLYRSDAPAAYALEVNAGFIDQHRIDTAWRLQLPFPPVP